MTGSQAPSITFFVPCLNEEGNVRATIDTLRTVMMEFPNPYEILVIDDASADGSIAEVEERARCYPEVAIRVIRNPVTRGLGRNYFVAALRAAGEYFMLVNGDAAEPPESIRAIVSHLGEADAIVPYFGVNDNRHWARRTISQAFTALVNLIGGHRLHYYNGPVLHKTENVRLWPPETRGFAYQAEILCNLLDEGATVEEVQIINLDRERGSTKAFRLGNLLSILNVLFHIFLRRVGRFVFRVLTPQRPSG